MAIKAVIFDCDGTLIDSEEAHFFSWQKALRNLGGDLSYEEYLSYVGQSGSAIARQFAEKMGKNCADELFQQKRDYFMERLHQGLPPIKETVAFVHRLMKEKKRLGLRLAIASATVKPEIVKNLDSLGLKEAFDLVLSGHEDLHEYEDEEGVNKPKPYIYLHAAKLLHVLPRECAVIEDSVPGLMAGKRAGCITVAVPNRFTEGQDLSIADARIESFKGISVEAFLKRLA